MATTVECFTEQEAKDSRRSHINSGHRVSLIAYNPEVDMYAYDVLDAEPIWSQPTASTTARSAG